MKAGYVLTPEAEQDLEDIFFFVRDRFGLLVAERVWAAYLEAFERIATFPESGAVRPELWPPPFRFVTVGPGLIAYRSDSETDSDRTLGPCGARLVGHEIAFEAACLVSKEAARSAMVRHNEVVRRRIDRP